MLKASDIWGRFFSPWKPCVGFPDVFRKPPLGWLQNRYTDVHRTLTAVELDHAQTTYLTADPPEVLPSSIIGPAGGLPVYQFVGFPGSPF